VAAAPDKDAARAAIQSITGVETMREVAQTHGVSTDSGTPIKVRAIPSEERNALEVEIVVDLSNAPPQTPRVAREVADEMVQRLRQSLAREAQGELAGQHERLKAEHDRAQVELAQGRQELTDLRDKLREGTGRAEASVERIRNDLAQLEDARQEVQLELESKAARMGALSENVAKLSMKIDQAIQGDAVSAELQKVVEARDQKAERVKKMVESGAANRADYDEAVAEAAEARARLMDRRSDAAERAGAGTLQDWNRELMRLSVDSAELQARLDKLNQRLKAYTDVADELDRLEAVQASQRDADRAMREAREHLRAVGRELARIRPARSIVLESQDRTGEPTPEGAGDAASESNARRQE
jgi:chromosome segregation ATPase